jgi:N-acetylmuramoyl-L-alanine amidase
MIARRIGIAILLIFAVCSVSLSAQDIDILDIDQISFGEKSLSFDSPIVRKNGEVFVSLRDIVPLLDATMGYDRKTDRYSIFFKKKKEYVWISPQHAAGPLGATLFYEGSLYVSVNRLAAVLGLKSEIQGNKIVIFHQQQSQRSLVLSSFSIEHVQRLNDGYIRFKGSSAFPSPKVSAVEGENGMKLDFYYVQLPKNPKIVLGEVSPIQRVLAENISPTHSRITLTFKTGVSYSSYKQSEKGGRIDIFNEIVSIKETRTKEGVVVNLTFKGNPVYSVGMFDQPNRLVVDFSQTVSRLPGVLKSEFSNAPYTRIRSSQFQIDPALSRVVFDLQESPYFHIRRKSQGLEFVFPFVKPEATEKKTGSIVVKVKAKQPRPLEGKLIVIDPGHGGDDPGALMNKHFYEKDYTLDISKRLQRLLTQLGAHVVMCREGDQNPSLEERTRLANINKTDVFISVHINSFISPFSGGTETYSYKFKDEPLAAAVHQEIIKSLKLTDKGIKRARLYVLRNSTMPAVLIEPLFITNPSEFKCLQQPYFRQKIAGASARGIVNYFREHPKPLP